MEKSEVYRMAKGFIVRHGTEIAWQRALAKAVEQPNANAVAAWLRIVDAIDEMTCAERGPEQTIQ